MGTERSAPSKLISFTGYPYSGNRCNSFATSCTQAATSCPNPENKPAIITARITAIIRTYEFPGIDSAPPDAVLGSEPFRWLGYSFFVLLSAHLWDKDPALQLPYTAVAGLSGLLMSMVLRHVFLRIWEYSPLKRCLISLLAVGIATSVWATIKMYVFNGMYPGGMEVKSVAAEFIGWFSYSFFIFLSWAALYYGIKSYQVTLEQKAKLLKITATAHQAQLKMLRYQLNPHFLFNTLNAIFTLVLDGKKDIANTL